MLSWQVVYLKKANSEAGEAYYVKEDFFQKMKSYHSNKVQKSFRLSFCLKISLSTNLQGQTCVIVKDFEK